MNPEGRNYPCGRKEQARDESVKEGIIPAEQKSKIEMNLKRRGKPKEYEDIPL